MFGVISINKSDRRKEMKKTLFLSTLLILGVLSLVSISCNNPLDPGGDTDDTNTTDTNTSDTNATDTNTSTNTTTNTVTNTTNTSSVTIPAVKGIFLLPPSLTGVSSTTRSYSPYFASTPEHRSNNLEMVKLLFSFVRPYVSLCNSAAQAVKAYINTASNYHQFLEGSYTENSNTFWVVITNAQDTNKGYTHRFAFYTDSNKTTLAFVFEVDNTNRNKGTAKISPLYNSNEFRGYVTIDFDGSGSNETMEINLTDWFPKSNVTGNNKWEADNLKINAVRSNGIISVNAGSYHPHAGTNLSNVSFQYGDFRMWADGVDRCYIFNAVVDETNDLSTINLAVAPASVSNSSNLYTTYTLANAYKKALVTHFQNQPESNISMSNLALWAGITNNIPVSNEALTESQLTTIISNLYTNESITNGGINAMYFVFSLDSPAYFNSNGYVTNGVASYSNFLASSNLVATPYVPADLKNLDVSFSN